MGYLVIRVLIIIKKKQPYSNYINKMLGKYR